MSKNFEKLVKEAIETGSDTIELCNENDGFALYMVVSNTGFPFDMSKIDLSEIFLFLYKHGRKKGRFNYLIDNEPFEFLVKFHEDFDEEVFSLKFRPAFNPLKKTQDKKAERFSFLDLSIPRRRYFSDESSLTVCPECGSQMIKENCAILLCIKSNRDEGEFITNLSGSHFCLNCPVVVFDCNKVDKAAKIALKGDDNLKYIIAGIVDMDSVPVHKRKLEFGSDDNPLPLVKFLPDLNSETYYTDRKPGRNDPCSCGSGKKYKKCCGRELISNEKPSVLKNLSIR